MNLKPYPDYKHCKTAWLPKIPSHWLEAQLRTCIEFIANGITATQIEQGEETVPVTRIETISTGRFNPEKAGHISRQEADPRRRMEVGDISLSNINSLSMIGNCAMLESPTELYAGMNLLHIRPSRDCFPEWLAWSFRNSQFRDDIESRAKPAINQASISQGGLKSIRIPIPPLEEQIQISRFLHHETAKIDALIAEQQRLIELLQEKRQVVISHAVTKGLNPNAPMKDSGVEWAPKLPEHWTAKHLKRNVRLLTEKTDTTECHVGLENLEGWTGRFIQTESDFQSEGVGFEADDILFGKLRPYLAKVWLADRNGEAIGDFHVLRPYERVNPRFIQYQLLTREVVDLVDGSSYGAKMPRASWGFLGCLEMPSPPAEEQLAIACFLDRETAKIDALIAEAPRAIKLLQERRSALISAAVTGQIDVRGLVEVGSSEQ